MNQKTHSVVVTDNGGPEVLEWVETDLREPGPGEVLVRHTAVGLNFIDVYHRVGLYPLDLPFTPGVEAAGTVTAVGAGVDDLQPGERVAYTGNGPPGSYCESRVLPRSRLVKLPDGIEDDVAAAIMLKGCTVEYLVRRTYPVSEGDRVLLHAAAGASAPPRRKDARAWQRLGGWRGTRWRCCTGADAAVRPYTHISVRSVGLRG